MSKRNDELPGDVEQDMQRLQRAASGGMEFSAGAIAEGVLGSVTALAGLAWLVAMWWVPGVIDGQVWLSMGLLGAVVLGVPTAAIYALRRGGVRALLRLISGGV